MSMRCMAVDPLVLGHDAVCRRVKRGWAPPAAILPVKDRAGHRTHTFLTHLPQLDGFV